MNHKQMLNYLQQHNAILNADGDVILSDMETQAAVLDMSSTHTVLTQYALLKFDGADVSAFLQSQFSSDIKALDETNAQWSSYSNAKGRMQASFLLWRRGESFFLMLRRDIADGFRRRLAMFVMRSRVVITLLEQALLLGQYHAQAERDTTPCQHADAAMRIDVGRISIHCVLDDEAAWPALDGALIASRAFDLYFIDAGIPWVSAACYEAFVPQMANLDLIGGISFRKGCYPGQEIVARTQYLGKVKRRMFIVEAAGAECPMGGDIRAEVTGEQAIGKVMLSAEIAPGQYRALVVMQIAAWDGHPYVDLQPPLMLSRRDMPYLIPELQSE